MYFEIARYLPPRALRVAELGCGAGEGGAAFLRLQPRADYWGFTEDPSEARMAAVCLPHACCLTAEGLDFAALGLYEADAIVVRGAYLRLLRQNGGLRRLADLLPEDGQLLLELPNPGYIRRVIGLLSSGAVGEEHCFSLGELQPLLTMAGLHSIQVLGRQDRQGDQALRESAEISDFLAALPGLPDGPASQEKAGTHIWVRAWLVRAMKRPVAPEQELRLHTLLGEKIATPRVRVLEPDDFLSTEPGVSAIVESGKLSLGQDRSFRHRILIRQRLSYTEAGQGLAFIETVRRQGYTIVAEMDDNPCLFQSGDPHMRGLDFLGSHAVQVSTEPLAEVIRQWNPHVKVLRNELRELPPPREYSEAAPVTLFFGALNRGEDWQEIMPVLNEAAARYGEGLRFKVLSDRKFFEALQTPCKEFIGTEQDYGGRFVPYEVYCRTLRSADIALLPLHDTEFNRTKSDLKFIECAGHGTVALASPTVYAATLRDGRTGFLYRSPGEFAERLRLLIEDRERRLETAAAAYRYVREERLLAQHYEERLAWYRELVQRRDELDRELVQRLRRWQEERKA